LDVPRVTVTNDIYNDPDSDLESASPPRAFWAGTKYSVKAIWAHRELLGLLVGRELKARYKDSSLGFIWTLIRPLTQFFIYYIAVGKFLGAERAVPQYAIYIFSGLTLWVLFSEIIGTATSSIVSNSGLVKKVYIPRELFPLASVGSATVNFLIQFGILIVAVLVTQAAPFFSTVVWQVPLAIIDVLIFSLAIGLLLSAANVYLRDVKHLVDVGLLVLFWASPIVYPFTAVHNVLKGNLLEQIYLWNPMTVGILAFRHGMWRAGSFPFVSNGKVLHNYWPPDLLSHLVITTIGGIILLWIAQRVFARLEGNFAQEL
jgi:ABC-2 type transport system permease protein